MMQARFNWPSRDLSPNARVHWSKKSKAAKVYRADCFYLAKLAAARVDWDGEIQLRVTFHPPSARHHDMDNCIASCKSGFDGLADALRVNDKLFVIVPAIGEPVKSGCVFVEIIKPGAP